MPLSEFLRMARGKLESGQTTCPTDLSSRPESDVVELLWENGQITTNGQSGRLTRAPASHSLPSMLPRVRDSGVGNATTSRIGKFGGVESFLNDATPIVPSGNLGLTQDDDMDPWLNYPMDDALPHYFLPEISGVTANGISADNSFLSADKRSSFDHSASNLNNCGNAMKASSSKAHFLGSWPHQQGQISDPSLRSGVSDIISNNVSKPTDTTYGSSVHCKDVVNDTSAKMERQNMGQLSNNSNFLNFSRFSRPTPFKANIASSSGVPTSVSSVLGGSEVKAKGSTSTGSNPVKSPREERTNTTQKGIGFHAPATLFAPLSSKQPVAKESFPAERTDDLFRESSTKNEKPLIPGNITADATKGHQDGERSMEPMVASSSVGSGNSVDRISCEQTHNSKRKFADTEETEWRSDDLGTESAGVNKPTSARGGNGSKRSRAAEVHNLSERRRRDRINEKMRALQELIPNCNKADKASMLDEAIEYLKTLQLQVQIMSMGAGLCMPQMMFPQHLHPAHMPHYSPMGVGMSYGMGMVDMHGGTHGMPVLQGAHFPSQMSGPINFQRFPGPTHPVYGHPSQGHPNTLPGAPLAPLTGRPPITSAMGLTPSGMGTRNEMPGMPPCLNSESPVTIKNSQSMHNGEGSKSIDCSSKQVQATNDGVLNQSAVVKENTQAPEVKGTPAALASTIPTDINKEAGGD